MVDLQSRLARAEALLHAAEKALNPFANAVYNDVYNNNGDITVSVVRYYSRDPYITAYFARKRLREYFTEQPKDKPDV